MLFGRITNLWSARPSVPEPSPAESELQALLDEGRELHRAAQAASASRRAQI
ncbi:MAG: hypothetical protein MO853_07580 [Candidatus Protistobacter heckmanni]|nr:hypothetical protein [Candidatus Protistobacter heckmanni]